MKLWTGRFQKELDKTTNDFNSSISFDSRMYQEDIEGSIAHATMLGQCGIIEQSEAQAICEGLQGILKDIQEGSLEIDPQQEDIHTFVEGELTQRLGSTGKRLHTARSRNDQVALDVRLYLKKQADELIQQVKKLVEVICKQAQEYAGTVMPGYTHLQRAQPITFGHHLMAYAEMLLRDLGRLQDAKSRMDVNPLGSGALASTTYPIDRMVTTRLLGFASPTQNSLDGVSDRDFCMERAVYHHGASVPFLGGDYPLVFLGVQIYRAGRRFFHRFQHYAPKEKPGYRGTGAGEGRACVWGFDHIAHLYEGPAAGL